MGALIVVESWFGNTGAVAGAVAEGLGEVMAVDLRNIADAPATLEPGIDLLVVGGPTHAVGMSRPGTRRDAARQAGHATEPGIGVREWLAILSGDIGRAAAFDTRIDTGWWAGSAASGIAKRLRRLGAELVAEPESFHVAGTPGPLVDGELDRARRWGEQLATAVSGAAGAAGRRR